jgi:hypothetical protein
MIELKCNPCILEVKNEKEELLNLKGIYLNRKMKLSVEGIDFNTLTLVSRTYPMKYIYCFSEEEPTFSEFKIYKRKSIEIPKEVNPKDIFFSSVSLLLHFKIDFQIIRNMHELKPEVLKKLYSLYLEEEYDPEYNSLKDVYELLPDIFNSKDDDIEYNPNRDEILKILNEHVIDFELDFDTNEENILNTLTSP